MVTTEELFRKRVEEYLTERHASLWGRSFDVIHPDTREQAIDYIQQLAKDLKLVSFVQGNLGDPLDGASESTI